MKQCPETNTLASVDELSGHVWIEELPTGGTIRFQVAASGLVTFAVGDRTYDAAGSVPIQYRRAAQLINDQINREALQAATNEPGDATFCGVATWNDGVEYEWSAVPAFVGVDVWVASQNAFLPPDGATGVFERLGLPTLPAIEKEVSAAHADLTRFDDDAAFPESAWWTGKVAGVLLRDKSSNRVAAFRSDRSEPDTATKRQSAADMADKYATDERIDQTIEALRNSRHSPTVASIRDRLVADIAREAYAELFSDDKFIISVSAFHSAVGKRVQQYQFTY